MIRVSSAAEGEPVPSAGRVKTSKAYWGLPRVVKTMLLPLETSPPDVAADDGGRREEIENWRRKERRTRGMAKRSEVTVERAGKGAKIKALWSGRVGR